MVSREALKLKGERLALALKVQSAVLRGTAAFLHDRGFVQLLPVVVSPITDPLNHSVFEAGIDYCGSKFQLTKSMILHKQLALASPSASKIFVVSPNVRLETPDRGATGRHLLEFTQVDFEWKHAKAADVMRFTEELFSRVFSTVKKDCVEEMAALGREVDVPSTPFKVHSTGELKEEYGESWEAAFSKAISQPAWVLDHEREFYDKEDETRPGHYLNYDIVYPQGFGEGLSGAEREHEYARIVERMKRNKMDLSSYAHYLEAARQGLLQPSAGAGFGVERMVRFLCGFERIEDASPFAKVPGSGSYIF